MADAKVLRIAPIVEGHGEERGAARVLLQRVWTEVVGGDFAEIQRPIRRPRGKLQKEDEVARAVDLAKRKVGDGLVLVLFDSDGACPAELASQVLEWGRAARADADLACVVAHPDFEVWFVSALDSIRSLGSIDSAVAQPPDPEADRQGKGWLKARMGRPYSETLDQPKLTSALDLAACRARSDSFDKLCRELGRRA